MINKKELEIELAKKGAQVLKNSMDVSAKHGIEIIELQKRIIELETIVKLHSDELKHTLDSLESNANIIKMMDEKIDELDGRFRRHVNNTDVHVVVQ